MVYHSEELDILYSAQFEYFVIIFNISCEGVMYELCVQFP